MIWTLIRSQCQGDQVLLHPEDLPGWLYNRVDYGILQNWVQTVWSWPLNNADHCHDARPWSHARYTDLMCDLNPDYPPF